MNPFAYPLTRAERATLASMTEEGALMLGEFVRMLWRRKEQDLSFALEIRACQGAPMNAAARMAFIRSRFREFIYG